MPTTPRKRPAVAGATRRGRYRAIPGTNIAADAVPTVPPSSLGLNQLTGDVTAGPGSGSQVATIGANKVVTAKVADAAITSAKLRDSAALSVIGRSANSTGVPADIAAGANGYVLQRLANVLGFSALDITAIADGSITLAKLADLAALSLLGRASNSSGVMAAITAASDGDVLRRSGTALGFGSIATAGITDAAVTLAKLANLATQTLHGRNTAGTGVPEAVTLTQLLDWIGSATQGDLLERGASGWQRLAGGALGTFLGGNGAGSDPSYQVPTGVGSIADFIQQAFYEVHGRPTTLVVMGIPTVTVAGTLNTTQSNYSAGSTVQLIQTGTSVDLRAGFASGRFDHCEADSDPTFEVVLRTGATITTIRILIGICDSDLSVDADDQGGTKKYMAFRYSTVAGDGGWVGICRDGTTQSAATATVASIAPSTFYKLKIRKSGSTVYFSVNGSAEKSISSNLPAAATGLGFAAYAYNASAGATHPWEFSRLRCLYGA